MSITRLQVDRLSAGYERPLFRDVSFSLEAQQVAHVMGGNGSGKTTLLNCLLGLFPATSGDIYWNGFELRANAFDAALYLGEQVNAQSYALGLKNALSVRENLQLYLSTTANALQAASQTVRQQRIDQVLEQLSLLAVANKRCEQLSSGQQRRVSLSKLLLNPCAVWVLDEPFAAVDKQGVVLLEGLISQHVEKGGSVLFTSHQDVSLGMSVRTVQL
ncbi:MAG: heme ABC exporter ATP-binding protein CcmA [Pseudomonadota bacterium]